MNVTRTGKQALLLPCLAAILVLAACGPAAGDDDDSSSSTEYGTDPAFVHPARYLFREFDQASEADLAFVLRALESSLESTVDFSSEELIDRSPTVDLLVGDDLAGLEHPDADPAECLAASLTARSRHDANRHASAALQTDQTPGDPSAPDHHDRAFRDGTEQCWGDRSCAALRADDTLTRTNALFTITLDDRVDYRWIDLGLPAPSAVAVGTDASNPGEPRWAILSHSWMPERAVDGNASFEQSYSVAVWISQPDSIDLPVLRYTATWAQTELGFTLDDTTVRQLMRGGIQDAWDAQEAWLETLP